MKKVHTDLSVNPEEESSALPYQTKTAQEWVRDVDGWVWREWRHGDVLLGWLKAGPCPRCGHPMSIYQNIVIGLAEEAPATSLAVCNCEEVHPGRIGTDSQGCGQRGTIAAKGVGQ